MMINLINEIAPVLDSYVLQDLHVWFKLIYEIQCHYHKIFKNYCSFSTQLELEYVAFCGTFHIMFSTTTGRPRVCIV